MKIIKPFYLLALIVAFATGCSKADPSGPACEENETTKVTFRNSGTTTLRVEVATQFDSQFNPVDPVFTFDLAAGASDVREFSYGHYFIQWKANCSTTCTQQTFYAKNYEQCQEYEEVQ